MIDSSKFINIIILTRKQILAFFLALFSHFYIRIYFIIGIGLVIFNWLVAYLINIRLLNNLTVLHYNIDFGVDLIGSAKEIYILPLLGFIFIIINIVPLSLVYKKNQFMAHILLASNLFSNLILSIALAAIYLFNFQSI